MNSRNPVEIQQWYARESTGTKASGTLGLSAALLNLVGKGFWICGQCRQAGRGPGRGAMHITESRGRLQWLPVNWLRPDRVRSTRNGRQVNSCAEPTLGPKLVRAPAPTSPFINMKSLTKDSQAPEMHLNTHAHEWRHASRFFFCKRNNSNSTNKRSGGGGGGGSNVDKCYGLYSYGSSNDNKNSNG